MPKFYYENTGEPGTTFFIIETEGAYEHGAYFDVAICVVDNEQDAQNICKRLNQLWNNQK